MLLQELIDLHSSFKGGNPDILGDAYLMRENPLYRAIRLEALKLGATFTEAWPEYLLFPFHQLGEIVECKKIPYVPSGRLLREIETRRPGTLTTEDLSIPESYHLHESSHVIAEELFNQHNLQTTQEKILKSLLCESFANSVDALTCAYVNDETHRYFLQQNNYMHPNKKYADAILRLQSEMGARSTFILTMIVYLHANFLIDKTAAELCELATPDARPSSKALKDCEILKKMADNLDPQFRLLTTKVYLNLEGHLGEVEELLNFPFVAVFNANSVFRDVTHAMANFGVA